MTKDCTTCRFEPDWENNNYSYSGCKKIPQVFQDGIFLKTSGTVKYEKEDIYGYNYTDNIKNCGLWEGKE